MPDHSFSFSILRQKQNHVSSLSSVFLATLQFHFLYQFLFSPSVECTVYHLLLSTFHPLFRPLLSVLHTADLAATSYISFLCLCHFIDKTSKHILLREKKDRRSIRMLSFCLNPISTSSSKSLFP